MRCSERGERITCSPRSAVADRVYCSTASVSVPSLTTKAPVSWAAAGAAAAASAAPITTTLRSITSESSIGFCRQPSAHPDRIHLVVRTDRGDHVHSLGDLAEDRVHAVEMRLRRVADEELAASG